MLGPSESEVAPVISFDPSAHAAPVSQIAQYPPFASIQQQTDQLAEEQEPLYLYSLFTVEEPLAGTKGLSFAGILSKRRKANPLWCLLEEGCHGS